MPNAIFMVCTPCFQAKETDHGVRLCERSLVGFYDPVVPPRQFKNWLAKHSKCGGRGNPDHFQLAHLLPQNNDQDRIKAIKKLEIIHDTMDGKLEVDSTAGSTQQSL